MYDCDCGKLYKYKHSFLHHSRFQCNLLPSPVLSAVRRPSEQETAPQSGHGDEELGGVEEEGVGGLGEKDGGEIGDDRQGEDKVFLCCDRTFRTAKARKNHRAKKKCQVTSNIFIVK